MGSFQAFYPGRMLRDGLRVALVLSLIGAPLAAGSNVTNAAGPPALTTLVTDTFSNATTASTGWKVVSGEAKNAFASARI